MSRISIEAQVECVEETLRALLVAGRCLSRRRRSTATVADLAVGMRHVLETMRLVAKYQTPFRRLVHDLMLAERDAAVGEVMEAFPGAEIVDIRETEEA